MEPTDIRARLREVAEDAPPAAQAHARPATQVLPPSAFRRFGSGEPDALEGALAYGYYARATEDGREAAGPDGSAAGADMIARYHAQATGELHAYAFRYLHNHTEQIRQDAIRDHLVALRRPPRFATLVLAAVSGVLLAELLLQDLAPWVAAQGGIAGLITRLLAGLHGVVG